MIVLIFIGSNSLDNYEANYSTADSGTSSVQNVVADNVDPNWTVFSSIDKMSGKSSSYASSRSVSPSPKMGFPYGDVTATLLVGCDSTNEWAYFNFSKAPNLVRDETKDGYNLIKTRIKWDGKVEDATLTQTWGQEFIHFQYGKWAIAKIESSRSALLELQWHGQRPAYFDFNLDGSSAALAEIRAKCSV